MYIQALYCIHIQTYIHISTTLAPAAHGLTTASTHTHTHTHTHTRAYLYCMHIVKLLYTGGRLRISYRLSLTWKNLDTFFMNEDVVFRICT